MQYLTEVCDGTTPAEVIETYVQGLVELPTWLGSMDGDQRADRHQHVLLQRRAARLRLERGQQRRDRPRLGVLGIDHQPVPGLYAAGELGSIWGCRYQTSTNFAEALVFGRIAGHTAAN